MEQARLLIAIVLSAAVFLVWQFFFVDRDAVQKTAEKTEQAPAKTEQVQPAQQPSATEHKDPTIEATGATGTEVAKPVQPGRIITVETPLYRARISERGAGIVSFTLKNYRETVAKNSPLKELIPPESIFETVLLGYDGQSLAGFDNAVFSANLNADTLNVKEGSQKITFSWTSNQAVVVEKTYSFAPDSYLMGLDVNVKNGSDRSIQDKLFITLRGTTAKDGQAYGFEGPSALINGSLEEVDTDDIADKNTYSGSIKWVSLQDRYFMTSIIPAQVEEASMRLYVKEGKLLESQYLNPVSDIRPGTQQAYQYTLFFGPRSSKILDAAGHDLSKALNFGFFDILAKPCVWLMNKLYSVIPNYGIAIIILTLLIKIVLWPLGSKSYKSMSEMKRIQPLMKEIREKYRDDKKKMNEEVMGLYRTYKINPLGGCLPMIVQLPVFFALYRMLYQAIELRHAPFFLWIDDLSAPDRLGRFAIEHIPFMEPPYGIPVLTIIMGASMLLQQKMSPPMGDPTQAKMMMFMPIIFTVIFINFSSGLVLYWLVNNILSIAQQYYIQKKYA
ncbi:MAG: membrane protein insertase YidC [Desulfobacteraceae bacterium]|jgi:YidC/Oxa1 family membrane protein insertase|nr:membrane protein insertase YidC [Desulfobacteraceae bacterium]